MGQHASPGHLQDFYDVKEKLGVGSFGLVKRGVHKKTGNEVAIKIIKKRKITAKTEKLIEREVGLMKGMRHTGIVTLLDCYESSKNVYLVLELCSGGEVFDRVAKRGKFSEQLASKAIKQIVEAVAYLHSKGIIHRDLKPENLLYVGKSDSSGIKITDFGFARRIDNPTDMMETTCGTLNYVAPEVLAGKPYGKECDLWSIGVILFVLLAGYLPFYGEDKRTTFKLIISADYDFDDESWDDISDSAKDLVKGLLTLDTKKRLTLKQVLEHPWIAKTDDVANDFFSDDFAKKFRKTARAEKNEFIDITAQETSEQPNLYGDDPPAAESKENEDDASKAKSADNPNKDSEESKPAKKAEAPVNPNSRKSENMKTIATGQV